MKDGDVFLARLEATRIKRDMELLLLLAQAGEPYQPCNLELLVRAYELRN